MRLISIPTAGDMSKVGDDVRTGVWYALRD